jgi:hypothetical protein
MPGVNLPVCVEVQGGLRGLGGVGQAGKVAGICDVLDWPLPEGRMRTWGSEARHMAGVRDRKG